MALPQLIEPWSDVCLIAERWRISLRLAVMLVIMRVEVGRDPRFRGRAGEPPQIYLISGYRDPSRQEAICRDLEGTGRPCADPRRSTHTSCPATGADLRVQGGPEDPWPLLGAIWKRLGGRWGGEFDSPDPNHFDLGPR
jgi:hypothetical protein